MSNAAAIDDAMPTSSTDDTTSSTSGSRRLWTVAAVVAVLVSVAVNVYVAWGARPAFMFDEIATLLQGRVVLGMDVPHVDSPGYYPGWAILTAPIWLFTQSPFTFYTAAIVVGLVVGTLTIWPLARVATRFGVTPAQGVVAAAIVMTLPARALQSDYALAERLIFLLVALTTLAAFRLWERPTYTRAVLVSLGAALTLLTHARMQVFAGAVALWLICFLVRSWKHALAGIVSLGLLYWAADSLALYINGLLVDSGFHQADHFIQQTLQAPPRGILNSFAGEAWSQMISSFGLVALGLVVAVAAFWRELKARGVGPYGYVLIISLSLYALSALRWSRDNTLYHAPWRRFDYWFYGRYIDPVVDIVVLLGLCVLIRAVVGRATLIWTWGLTLVLSVVVVLVVAPDAPTWAYVTPAHAPGAMAWWWALPNGIPGNVHTFPTGTIPSFTNANRFWLLPTVTVVVVLAVLTVLLLLRHRARALAAAALVLVVAAVGSVVADGASNAFHERNGTEDVAIVHTVRQILVDHPHAVVSYEAGCRPRRKASPQRNWLMWWMLPAIVQRDYTWGDDVVFSCDQGFPASVPGAVELKGTIFQNTTVWIMPGKLLDSLRKDGTLPPVARTIK